MTRHLLPTLCSLLLSLSSTSRAGDEDSRSILQEYLLARPTEADLAIYRLDWAPDLEEARRRAAEEGRPQ